MKKIKTLEDLARLLLNKGLHFNYTPNRVEIPGLSLEAMYHDYSIRFRSTTIGYSIVDNSKVLNVIYKLENRTQKISLG